MRLIIAVLVGILLCTGAQGQKKKKCRTVKVPEITSSTEITSPDYPKEKALHKCFPYKFDYTAPKGKVLKLSCSEFNIACSKRGMSRFLSADEKKQCGQLKDWEDVVSDDNTMSITYRSANKRNKRFSFLFKCTIEAIDPPPSEECDCGNRKGTFRSRIVGGTVTDEGELPYQVSIQWRGQHVCGGILVDKCWVVTAAHCEITTGSYKVVLGEHILSKKSGNEKTVEIAKVITHPQYDYQTNRYDLAVIKLKECVEYGDYIQPICLPDKIKDNSLTGKELIASGWGSTQSGSQHGSDKLLEVNVKVISNRACKKKGGWYQTDVFPENICTLTPGKDACQGDSGGPLAYYYNNKFYLIGVTSWGIGCGGKDSPGVWTDCINPHILKWIRSNIGMKCKAP